MDALLRCVIKPNLIKPNLRYLVKKVDDNDVLYAGYAPAASAMSTTSTELFGAVVD